MKGGHQEVDSSAGKPKIWRAMVLGIWYVVGVVWWGLMWCVLNSMVRHGVGWCCVAGIRWCDIVLCGVVCDGVVWYVIPQCRNFGEYKVCKSVGSRCTRVLVHCHGHERLMHFESNTLANGYVLRKRVWGF